MHYSNTLMFEMKALNSVKKPLSVDQKLEKSTQESTLFY